MYATAIGVPQYSAFEVGGENILPSGNRPYVYNIHSADIIINSILALHAWVQM